MQLYPTVLLLHSYWRWAVLLAAVIAILVAIRGLAGGRPFLPAGKKAGIFFVGALDMQFLLGLILEFLSPVVKIAFSDFGAAMKSKELRFFAVEHVAMMLIAVVLAHVGSVLAKKAKSDAGAYRRMLICYALSLIVILAGIPWFRPLFPGS